MFTSLRESQRRLEAAQRIAHVRWCERDFHTRRVAPYPTRAAASSASRAGVPTALAAALAQPHPSRGPRESRRCQPGRAVAADRATTSNTASFAPTVLERVVHSQSDVVRDELYRPLRQFRVMQDITELRQSRGRAPRQRSALSYLRRPRRGLVLRALCSVLYRRRRQPAGVPQPLLLPRGADPHASARVLRFCLYDSVYRTPAQRADSGEYAHLRDAVTDARTEASFRSRSAPTSFFEQSASRSTFCLVARHQRAPAAPSKSSLATEARFRTLRRLLSRRLHACSTSSDSTSST